MNKHFLLTNVGLAFDPLGNYSGFQKGMITPPAKRVNFVPALHPVCAVLHQDCTCATGHQNCKNYKNNILYDDYTIRDTFLRLPGLSSTGMPFLYHMM